MQNVTQRGPAPSRADSPALQSGFVRFVRLLVDILTDRKNLRSGRLSRQLKDYVTGGASLALTRQGMYVGSGLLAAYYYDAKLAFMCFVLFQITEALDNVVSANVIKWDGKGIARAIRYRNQLLTTSILSGVAVVIFAVLVADIEGPVVHFTPLVFLLAAGLFAAVNNRQLPSVLYAKLVIYGLAFLYIPLKDIWVEQAPLESVLWLQLFTVLFVLFFIFNCSIIFLQLYLTGLDRLDELVIERDKAHAAYELKSQFVSVVSHELRTPLHSIMGSLSLLNTGKLEAHPDRARKMVKIAHANSKRLAKLIDDLLDLQKLEAEQMAYDFAAVDLTKVVNVTVESVQGLADQHEIGIRFVNPAVKLVARADNSKIQQVLTNLLSNAIKFSATGGRVDIRLFANAGRVGVEVRDYGIGIPEGSRALVFGKFHQIDSSDERNHEGSGLGLSIAEQIITAHDGNIDYVSELGKGTSFLFELPIFEADA
jgi:signal transduction histidine kinase